MSPRTSWSSSLLPTTPGRGRSHSHRRTSRPHAGSAASPARARAPCSRRRCPPSAWNADQLQIALELPSNEAVCAAVEAGAGVTIFSRLVAERALKAGSLIPVTVDLPRRNFSILRHKERYVTQVSTAFHDLAVAAQRYGRVLTAAVAVAQLRPAHPARTSPVVQQPHMRLWCRDQNTTRAIDDGANDNLGGNHTWQSSHRSRLPKSSAARSSPGLVRPSQCRASSARKAPASFASACRRKRTIRPSSPRPRSARSSSRRKASRRS